jgi:hypothetical protein
VRSARAFRILEARIIGRELEELPLGNGPFEVINHTETILVSMLVARLLVGIPHKTIAEEGVLRAR